MRYRENWDKILHFCFVGKRNLAEQFSFFLKFLEMEHKSNVSPFCDDSPEIVLIETNLQVYIMYLLRSQCCAYLNPPSICIFIAFLLLKPVLYSSCPSLFLVDCGFSDDGLNCVPSICHELTILKCHGCGWRLIPFLACGWIEHNLFAYNFYGRKPSEFLHIMAHFISAVFFLIKQENQ